GTARCQGAVQEVSSVARRQIPVPRNSVPALWRKVAHSTALLHQVLALSRLDARAFRAEFDRALLPQPFGDRARWWLSVTRRARRPNRSYYYDRPSPSYLAGAIASHHQGEAQETLHTPHRLPTRRSER